VQIGSVVWSVTLFTACFIAHASQHKINSTQLNSMPHGMKNEMKQNKTMKVLFSDNE
jgi:hypothetical protein